MISLADDDWVLHLDGSNYSPSSKDGCTEIDIGLQTTSDVSNFGSRITLVDWSINNGGYSSFNDVKAAPEINIECIKSGIYTLVFAIDMRRRYAIVKCNREILVNGVSIEPSFTLSASTDDNHQYAYRLSLSKGDLITIKHKAGSATGNDSTEYTWDDDQIHIYQPSTSTSRYWYAEYKFGIVAWGYGISTNNDHTISVSPVSLSDNFKLI